ncbi:thioredoxin reductase [Rozella allomycis CSF55]|uniref:Thioredoxin reductase n=1 Tax=Rozella allomycis (strain CSF55) TaxID=988480 RepID=A0A4P9YDL0_ROZAC|nr:thioredoxin reductase [Rozella allomycis CSF55]
MSETNIEKVVIVGSGPAAHTAAIYTGRAQLNPVMFEGFMAGNVAAGGQLTTTTEVENFPGFPEGIMGPELMERMRKQSIKCGTRIFTETVNSVDLSLRPFVVKTDERSIKTWSIIVATGATAKRDPIPGTGDNELWNRGVSACAVCDGAAPIFRNKPIFVIGGGDSACEEAHFLTRYASKVYIVHRRDELRASKIMQLRVQEHEKIEILYSHKVTRAIGEDLLRAVEVEDLKTGKKREMPANGLFFAIGHKPNTDFLNGQLPTDDQGYLISLKGSETTIEGVFVAGDCKDKKYRQAITAAGSGVKLKIRGANIFGNFQVVPGEPISHQDTLVIELNEHL